MTYSIVALDRATGELGVAVQSHYFQVGPVVPWALAGVGAIATQSQVNVSFGPLGLEHLKAGRSAGETIKALLAGDSDPEARQLAIVDASGNVAVHTGTRCIPDAGHRTGEAFSCQANLMEKDTVWDAMAHAYSTAEAPLAERLMAALDAAEAEGGDIRGRQSAAMIVVTGKPTGHSWEDRVIDLRVEDSPEPLVELRRLLRIKRAYQGDEQADRLELAGEKGAALARRLEGAKQMPELVEIGFWTGLALAEAGDLDGGCRMMAPAVARDRRWVETVNRIARAERIPQSLADVIVARLTTPQTRRL